MKTHDDYIIIAHKLVLAAAHCPGLCWKFQKGFPEPLETFLDTPCSTNISLLPVCQVFKVVHKCVMLLFFVSFCAKQCDVQPMDIIPLVLAIL